MDTSSLLLTKNLIIKRLLLINLANLSMFWIRIWETIPRIWVNNKYQHKTYDIHIGRDVGQRLSQSKEKEKRQMRTEKEAAR